MSPRLGCPDIWAGGRDFSNRAASTCDVSSSHLRATQKTCTKSKNESTIILLGCGWWLLCISMLINQVRWIPYHNFDIAIEFLTSDLSNDLQVDGECPLLYLRCHRDVHFDVVSRFYLKTDGSWWQKFLDLILPIIARLSYCWWNWILSELNQLSIQFW